jgi:vesicle coat complex subunit
LRSLVGLLLLTQFRADKMSTLKLLSLSRWGQVFILDSLSRYKAKDARDAESIVERVTPRLQHANCAVVLSSVKVIMQQLELITSTGESLRTLIEL